MDIAVLRPEDLEHVRSSIRQVAGGAAKLLTADPTEGSIAASIIRSSLNHDLPAPAQGRSGLLSARLSAQSAVECALAFVDLIVGGRRSVSLAPVVRGVVEAAAKTHYLLSAGTDLEFLLRHVSLAIDELEYPVRYSKFETWAGAGIDGPTHRIEMETAFKTLKNGKRFVASSATGRVADVLGIHSQADPAIYSQLSGVAHAATSALGMFVEPATGSLALPRVLAAEYVAYVFACVVTVADDTATACGFEGAIAERWQAARRRGWDEFVIFRELVD